MSDFIKSLIDSDNNFLQDVNNSEGFHGYEISDKGFNGFNRKLIHDFAGFVSANHGKLPDGTVVTGWMAMHPEKYIRQFDPNYKV